MAGQPVYDVAIAGGGPAGSACAILCAGAGLRTLVLERARFPRDKVCGDCVNPGCWPLFEQLGVAQAVLDAPRATIGQVAFFDAKGERSAFALEADAPGEIAITRRVLDAILLARAREAGAEIREETTLRGLTREAGGLWHIDAGEDVFTARQIVAADGRNSTVARLLGAAPPARRGRIALQAHIAIVRARSADIELHLLSDGYCGTAPIPGGLTNICLVATPGRIEALKAAAAARFGFPPGQEWRAIAPLERAPVGPLRGGVVYVGDAARVVEPFTGEGIYYALGSGVLAATHILARTLDQFPAAHAALYRRRLWINRLARWAVTHPRSGAMLLRLLRAHPASLRLLVKRVTSSAAIRALPPEISSRNAR